MECCRHNQMFFEVTQLFIFRSTLKQPSKEPENSSPSKMENSSAISALDFPPELTVQMMKKLKLADLLQLFILRSDYAEFRFEKSLEKSMGNITLNQLCQIYSEATTEYGRNQCFHKQVLGRMEIDTFNEVVHLSMRPENEVFFSNDEILETFGNQIILVEEAGMRYTADFWGCFKKLLEKINGDIFLVLVGNINARQLWDKQEGFNIIKRIKYLFQFSEELPIILPIFLPNLEFKFCLNLKYESYNLEADFHNCVDTTKNLISMMKSKHVHVQRIRRTLESALPTIQTALALHQYHYQKMFVGVRHHYQGMFDCVHCGTRTYLVRRRDGDRRIKGETAITILGNSCVTCAHCNFKRVL